MSEQIIPVLEDWKKRAFVGASEYAARYGASVEDPEGFWGKEAGRLDWLKPFTKVSDVSFDAKDLHIRWFEDGAL
ncbi:MAG: acetyl-coenzyme A synthetase, partial [Alphaproteobacteria bacterium]|nr:acetyl-coenzyme A synthetase [Alphaproteobacteria bacterium]